ncbi:BC1872 family protein [Paenibacillus motobuensis]|uniref:Phage ABA sandwich domain-containing protein n=1 Tax=Paenibacillus motobuensis TaxID=295324 RepID=A0ABN0YIF8_9BACL
MNREQIIAKWDGMTPCERDAWVAEAVFGWDSVRIKNARIAWELGVCGAETVPYYTSDISAAWAVVEKAEWSAKIKYARTNTCANFHRNGWAQFDVYAPTAPEAICLAAIFAKIATVEGVE